MLYAAAISARSSSPIASVISAMNGRIANRGRPVVGWLARVLVSAILTSMVSASLVPSTALAQDYPSKPIRLIVPFPVGGSSDAIGRMLADRLGPILKQTIVVENKAGAGGMIGTDAVAKAGPDGYSFGGRVSRQHTHLHP
jgi:tripartite-type tricarboxylate transporter receptor subunit TctC